MVTLRAHDIMIFWGMNGKLLQRISFLKKAKKTCKPKHRDLNRDRMERITYYQIIKILYSSYYVAELVVPVFKRKKKCLREKNGLSIKTISNLGKLCGQNKGKNEKELKALISTFL